MWNRFLSSPYAHFGTAMVLTFGLVLVLLTGHSGKPGMAKVDVSAQKALPYAARPALASHANARDDRSVETSFDDPVTTGQAGAR
jgi:hypothetical protein